MASGQINSSGAAGRYGTALFELASENKSLVRVEKELLALKKLLLSSAPLAQMSASPLISADEKTAALLGIAKKAKYLPLVANFLGVIAQNGRADHLVAIIDAFLARIAAAKGALQATAKTAQALTPKQKTNLSAGLKKALGRTVKLETEVDPRLLGGLIVQIGSRMFDSSLKTQLESLKLTMKES